MSNDVIVNIVANAKQAIKAASDFKNAAIKSFDGFGSKAAKVLTDIAKKAASGMAKFGKTVGSAFKKVGSALFNLKTLVAGFAAFLIGRQLLNGLKKVTAAAAVQEDAVNNLNTALRLTGKYSEATSLSIQDFASELQRTSKYGDEVILENAALIQNLGRLDKEGLKRATKSAVELSSALGIDLATASQLVGRAAQGEIGTFSRYGIKIQKGATAAETFSNVLKKIETQFSGSAEAQIKTYAGATAQLSNTWGDLLEKLGETVIKNPVVLYAIGLLNDVFLKLQQAVSDNKETMGNFISAVTEIALKSIPIAIRSFAYMIGLIDILIKTWKDLGYEIKRVGQAVGLIQKSPTTINEILAAAKVVRPTNALKDFFNATIATSYEVEKIINKIDEAGNKTAIVLKTAEDQAESTGDAVKKAFTVGDAFSSFSIEGAKKFILNIREGITNIATKFKEVFSLTNLKQVITDIANLSFDDIATAFKDGSVYVYNSITSAASAFSTVFGADLVGYISTGVQSLIGLPGQFLKALKDFDKILDDLIDAVSDAVINLPAIFDKVFSKFIANFPKLVRSVVGLFGVIAEKIAESAPAIIDAILQGLTIFFKKLPEVFDKLAKAFAPALKALLRGLPDVIRAIFEGLPSIVKSIADEIPAIMEVMAQYIGPVVEALIEGMAASSGEIIAALIDSLLIEGGLERIIKAILNAIPRVAQALAEGFARGIYKAASAIGASISRGFNEAFSNVASNIGKNIANGIKIPAPSFKIPVAKPTFSLKVPTPSWLSKLKISEPSWLNKLKIGGAGGGGSSGPITGIKGSPIATGGLVPKGFPNDTFPAALTSNEVVVPVKSADNLFRLIDSLSKQINSNPSAKPQVGGEQNLTINLKIGEKDLAGVLLNLNRQGFRTA